MALTSCNDLSVSASVIKACSVFWFLHSRCHAGNYPTTKDSISNYMTKVKRYKNASSPVNRVCGRIPRIPPESATGITSILTIKEYSAIADFLSNINKMVR